MEEFKDIVRELKKFCINEELNVSPDVLFDCATRIYNSGHINNKQSEPKEELATQKQVDTLYKLNVNFNAETITKKDASELIGRMLPKKEWDKNARNR